MKRVEYGINTVISVDLPPSEMEIIVEDKKKKKKLENENNNSSLVIENSLRYLTIRHLRPTGRVAWAVCIYIMIKIIIHLKISFLYKYFVITKN